MDVDTELLIMSEEGMLNGFCEQSEAELTSALRQSRSASQTSDGATGKTSCAHTSWPWAPDNIALGQDR